MDEHHAIPAEITPEVYGAYRPGDPHRVVLHWTLRGGLALAVSGYVGELRAQLAEADALLAAFDETEGAEATCEHCGHLVTLSRDTWRDSGGDPGCAVNRGGHSPDRDEDGNPVVVDADPDPGCSCGMADLGAPGHDGHDDQR